MPSRVWSTVVVASISSPSSTSRTVAGNSSCTTAPAASRLPTTCRIPSPTSWTRVDVNRSSGCSRVSKKSGERRCLSRVRLPVSRLTGSTVSSIVAPSGPVSYAPSNRSKRPCTVLAPQNVLTVNSTDVLSLSSVQWFDVTVGYSIAIALIRSSFARGVRQGCRAALPCLCRVGGCRCRWAGRMRDGAGDLVAGSRLVRRADSLSVRRLGSRCRRRCEQLLRLSLDELLAADCDDQLADSGDERKCGDQRKHGERTGTRLREDHDAEHDR